MYRVLVADDEPIERTVVCRTIQKYFADQIEVVLAENGREAVQFFEEQNCQIALLDIEMPGINGLEAAERIREKNEHCCIIFLTAFDEFSYAKRALLVRAMDYLLKPCADEELIAVLEEAMRMTAECVIPLGQEARCVENDETWQNLKMNAVAENILLYIQSHYMEDISLQDVAGAMNYSDAYFCKIFKHCFDKSFIVYLSEFRVEKAKRLLEDALNNVKDVSCKVGYRDSNYFTKVFKRVTGVTPSEYRMQVLAHMEKAGVVR